MTVCIEALKGALSAANEPRSCAVQRHTPIEVANLMHGDAGSTAMPLQTHSHLVSRGEAAGAHATRTARLPASAASAATTILPAAAHTCHSPRGPEAAWIGTPRRPL